MPAQLGVAESPSAVRVTVSAVNDLTFSLFALTHNPHPRSLPWLNRLMGDELALRDEVAAFWPEPPPFAGKRVPSDEWGEIPLVALMSGTFAGPSLEPFFAALPDVLTRAIEVPELASEAPGVRELYQQRLDQLCASDELRGRYIDLLQRVWGVLTAGWEAEGLANATRAAGDIERRLAAGANLVDVIPTSHLARRDANAELMRDATAGEDMLIVPLGLTPDGQFFFALPGFVVVAFGPEAGRKAEARRNLGEQVAQRFKVLSDPTRAALLNLMMHRAISITDLACYFDLSQPTVSVHVKMLREAGLLQAERAGAQTLYSAPLEVVRQFAEGALSDLLTEPLVADLPPPGEGARNGRRDTRAEMRRAKEAAREARERGREVARAGREAGRQATALAGDVRRQVDEALGRQR